MIAFTLLVFRNSSITTGSIYCDRSLRGSGFDGEKIQSSSVLVTKEHLRIPRWTHTRKAHEFMSKVHIMIYRV